MLTVVNKNKLLKITHLASKIIRIPTPNLSDCVTLATIWRAHITLNDPDQPLHWYFIPLPSSHKYRSPTVCAGRLSIGRVLFLQLYTF